MDKQSICEIGINAGHSLLLMLDVNPTAKYLLFDLGIHRYTRPCIEYIRAAYPTTELTIIYGDSRQTITQYITITQCKHLVDLCHIDGGHTPDVVESDLNSAVQLSAINGIIVIDDTDYPRIDQAVNNRLKLGELVLSHQPQLLSTDLHRVCQSNHLDPIEYIDHIFYINLNRRPDRRQEICQEFDRMSIPVNKFERYPAHLSNPGTYGCGRSHIQVLRTAIERNYGNVLVMEDDFEFLVTRPELDYYLEYLFTEFKQPWDVIMLTYALDQQEDHDAVLGRVIASHNAAGYLVNRHYLRKLADTLEQGNQQLMETGEHWFYANDAYWINLQPNGRWFYFKHQIGHQRTTVGDTGYWATPEI